MSNSGIPDFFGVNEQNRKEHAYCFRIPQVQTPSYDQMEAFFSNSPDQFDSLEFNGQQYVPVQSAGIGNVCSILTSSHSQPSICPHSLVLDHSSQRNHNHLQSAQFFDQVSPDQTDVLQFNRQQYVLVKSAGNGASYLIPQYASAQSTGTGTCNNNIYYSLFPTNSVHFTRTDPSKDGHNQQTNHNINPPEHFTEINLLGGDHNHQQSIYSIPQFIENHFPGGHTQQTHYSFPQSDHVNDFSMVTDLSGSDHSQQTMNSVHEINSDHFSLPNQTSTFFVPQNSSDDLTTTNSSGATNPTTDVEADRKAKKRVIDKRYRDKQKENKTQKDIKIKELTNRIGSLKREIKNLKKENENLKRERSKAGHCIAECHNKSLFGSYV